MGDDGISSDQRWLLLVHQLPAKPAYFRVKIWRRLHSLGAVAVKSSVYALPAGPGTQEDFEWLLKEIVEGGGEAMVAEARLIDGLTDNQVRGLFDGARDEDYEAIVKDARALAASVEVEGDVDRTPQVRRLRKRLADVAAIDFFGASGRLSAESLVAEIEASLDTGPSVEKQPKTSASDLRGRTWVTRKGVHVDRIACAWLIRRFIDPDAAFQFVSGKAFKPRKGELRFDMFEGEFTHEGDRCSFEVLVARASLNDQALVAMGEIVHDIDLKDGKFGREETVGIASLIDGIAAASTSDEQRIERGGAVFDNLYQFFRNRRG